MRFLNNYHIKWIAILTMTIDHIGFIFQLNEVYRTIGRLSFPLFAFLIYQGFLHSKDVKKYFLRLFLFGIGIELIMLFAKLWIPLPGMYLNIFLTLAFGLLSLMILDTHQHIIVKLLLVLLLAYIAHILKFDYGWYGVVYIASFYFLRDNYIIPFILQLLINYIHNSYFHYNLQYFSLLSWLIILLYNGKSGRKTRYSYLFYLYYPLHMALLYLIQMLIYH